MIKLFKDLVTMKCNQIFYIMSHIDSTVNANSKNIEDYSKCEPTPIFKSEYVPTSVVEEDINIERNYVEGYIILQEFYNDSTVFIVGSAPFGRIWFDRERVHRQFLLLLKDWMEEYGDNPSPNSKKPRIIRILIDETDPMFNEYIVSKEIRPGMPTYSVTTSAYDEELQTVNAAIQLAEAKMELSKEMAAVKAAAKAALDAKAAAATNLATTVANLVNTVSQSASAMNGDTTTTTSTSVTVNNSSDDTNTSSKKTKTQTKTQTNKKASPPEGVVKEKKPRVKKQQQQQSTETIPVPALVSTENEVIAPAATDSSAKPKKTRVKKEKVAI